MKLALSNICGHEIEGQPIETVYTKLDGVVAKGHIPIAVQSLLFDRPDLHVLDKKFIFEMQKRLEHIKSTGCNIAVFGSPKNRNLKTFNNEISYNEQNRIYKILSYLKDWSEFNLDNFNFLIEQIPGNDTCIFTHPDDFLDNDIPRDHLDTNNLFEVTHKFPFPDYKFDIQASLKELKYNILYYKFKHVHISAKEHKPLIYETEIDYEMVIDTLKENKYDGYLSIEMLPCSLKEAEDSVELIRRLL